MPVSRVLERLPTERNVLIAKDNCLSVIGLYCEINLHLSLTFDSVIQEWNDYNLRWNDSEYGGVKDLRITPNKLWKPDVLMYNR